MEIRSFDNIEDMFNYLSEQNKIARKWADEHNAVEIIEHFDYYYSFEQDYDLDIIGKKESGLMPRDQYESEEEYQYEVQSTEEDKRNGYIFGRWYSDACPEGELGTTHLSRVMPITEETFNMALKMIQEGG